MKTVFAVISLLAISSNSFAAECGQTQAEALKQQLNPKNVVVKKVGSQIKYTFKFEGRNDINCFFIAMDRPGHMGADSSCMIVQQYACYKTAPTQWW